MRAIQLLFIVIFLYACCNHDEHSLVPPAQLDCDTLDCAYLEAAEAFSVTHPHLLLPPLDQTLESVNATSYLAPEPAIAYNAKWMEQMRRRYGTDMVRGVFAHELGHAVCFQERGDTSESCADFEGGCLLAVMQRSPVGFMSWVQGGRSSARYASGDIRAATFLLGHKKCSQTLQK